MKKDEKMFKRLKDMIMNDDYNGIKAERCSSYKYPCCDNVLNEDYSRVYNSFNGKVNHESSYRIDFIVMLVCLQENKDMNEKMFNDRSCVTENFLRCVGFDFQINNNNVMFLLFDCETRLYHNERYFHYLVKKVYENNIENNIDFNLRFFTEDILKSSLMDDGFMDYIIGKLKINLTTLIRFVYHHKFFEKLIKQSDCNLRDQYNLDILLYCVFKNKVKNIEILLENNVNLSTIKISREYITHFNEYNDYVSFDSLNMISHLENFDDFVNNNLFLLMKICDAKSMNFILTNFDVKFDEN